MQTLIENAMLTATAMLAASTPAALSLLKISTGLREAGDFREPAVPSRSW
jgi:hypothetical protein